jgi:hypothetical protein
MEISTLKVDPTYSPFRNDHRWSVSGRSERQTAALEPELKRPWLNGALATIPSAHAFNWLESKFPCSTTFPTAATDPMAPLLGCRDSHSAMALRAPFPFLQSQLAGHVVSHVGDQYKAEKLGSNHIAHIDLGSR